ncbi:MAG: hypothetical protein AAF206_31005, partial [Bacteroidota bacterium]
SYTRSTNQLAKFANDGSQFRQLIYQPVHQGQVSVGWQHRFLRLQYGQNVVGKRYTTSDNFASLPAYFLGHLSLTANWQAAQYRIQSSLRIDNIWNQSYQVISGRPMPLRSINFSLLLHFHQQKT